MANVVECDRCGKKIEFRRNTWCLRAKISYAKIMISDDEMKRYDYDLCADCGKALMKWLEGKKHDKA